MGFQADKAVTRLDYDFSPYSEAKGTTPEPSQSDLREFRRRLLEVAKRAAKLSGDDEPETNAEALATLERVNLEEVEGLEDMVVEVTASITAGQPSRQEIDALPGRVKQAYCGWLGEQLAGNPQMPDTSDSRATGTNGSQPSPSGIASA